MVSLCQGRASPLGIANPFKFSGTSDCPEAISRVGSECSEAAAISGRAFRRQISAKGSKRSDPTRARARASEAKGLTPKRGPEVNAERREGDGSAHPPVYDSRGGL